MPPYYRLYTWDADFGLSIKLDARATHVSNLFQGTVTHMAPEVLMEGKTSKSADVYGESKIQTLLLTRSDYFLLSQLLA